MRSKLLCGLFLGLLTTHAFGASAASGVPNVGRESAPVNLSGTPGSAATVASEVDTDPVNAMSDPIYLRMRADLTTLVTPYLGEAESAAQVYGFTSNLESPFKVSVRPARGLSSVHRLWSLETGSFMNAVEGSDVFERALSKGYEDQGVIFYALAEGVEGRTSPVYNYVRNEKYRPAGLTAGKELEEEGWKRSDVIFHVPDALSPDSDSTGDEGEDGETGSLPIGSAEYPVPKDAVFVSPEGKDSGSGREDSPVRTISRAVNIAPTNGTVVIRGGIYRETVTIYRSLTVQNSPGEAVWLDGTIEMNGWVRDGETWRRDNWVETNFDNSPTYNRGAPDGNKPFWTFVNSKYPMASNPEQVYVDGAALKQVGSRRQVTEGTFYVDRPGRDLYLGTNPDGKKIEVSSRIRALEVRADNSVIRGIGIRRYSPSVPDIAAVTLEQPGIKMENVVIENASTTGLGIMKSNVVVNHVTVKGSGMLGIHGRNADNLKVSNVLVTQNNTERFNMAPVAGGMKLGNTRGIFVTNSSFVKNYGHGMWEDLSDYDSVIRKSRFSDNKGTGLFLELSAKAVVGDNIFSQNGEFGMKVNNTQNVQIWNNTFVGNSRPVNLVQDLRRNNDPNDPATDPRIPWPDPEIPWTLGNITVQNNVFSKNPAGNCLICVEDYSQAMTAEQMNIRLDNNLYHRTSPSEPTWLAVWSRGQRNPGVFTTLEDFTASTRQERNGLEYIRESVVGTDFKLSSDLTDAARASATEIPVRIADALGISSGTKMMGAVLKP